MTTLTVDAHRSRMLQCLEAGNGYEFLTVAAPYLNVCRDDHYIRLMAIREYLKLGLVIPARELLEPDPSMGELPSEFAPIRASLAMVSEAAVPWSQCAERFEANLAALMDRSVDVVPVREAWTVRRGDFQLFRDSRNVDQVRMRDPTGGWQWIPRLGDHRAAAYSQPMPEDKGAKMPGPYLFEGLDLGWYFKRVYEATIDTFLGYSCALFVVEPDPAMVAFVLHLHDWREILSDARVFWFTGESYAEDLRRTWEDDPDLPFPRHGFTLSAFRPRCSPNAVNVVQGLVRTRDAAIQQSLADLEARYASRDMHYWSGRFDEALTGRGDPLRILAPVSTHTTFLQYSMRDARQAFEALGHRCIVLTETTPHHIIGPLTYHKTIREFDPELLFAIDHLRPEFGDTLPANLPVMTWDQDSLPGVFTEEKVKRMSPLDTVVGLAQFDCLGRFGCDPRQFLCRQMPTSPQQFDASDLTDEELAPYRCDVSYVSHASQTAEAFHNEELEKCADDGLRRLMTELFPVARRTVETNGPMNGPGLRRMLLQAEQKIGVKIVDRAARTHVTGWYLWRLCDRLFRHQALTWATDWARQRDASLRIYGNGWDKHPTLARFSAGPAENGRELLCVYRASKINLQLMPAGFLHQRALDGLAGGGFFLARARPSDQRNPRFTELLAAIRARGLKNGAEVFQCNDEALTTAFRDAMHDLEANEDEAETMFHLLAVRDQTDYPSEIFPRFHLIRFDDVESFASVADRFLHDDALRQSIADEMRQVVLERFTYEATMQRFLQFAAESYAARTQEAGNATLP